MEKRTLIAIGILLLGACVREARPNEELRPLITFSVSQQSYTEPLTRSAELPSSLNPVPVKADLETETPLFLYTDVQEGMAGHPETKGSLVNSDFTPGSFSFGVSEHTSSDVQVGGFQNVNPSFSSSLFHSGIAWEGDAYDEPTPASYHFHAYYPFVSGGADASKGLSLTDGNKSITYNAASVTVANQPDLMTAYASTSYDEDGVELEFGHRLCAVRIVLGTWASGCTIRTVQFGSIVASGKLSLSTGSWSNLESAAAYSVSGITERSTAGDVAAYLTMIPQAVDTQLTITLDDGAGVTHTLQANVSGTWTAGNTVTYTLDLSNKVTLKASYQSWGGYSGYTAGYESGESFGVYAIETATRKVIFVNKEMTAAMANTTPTLNTDCFTSSNYTYFIYYPYQSSGSYLPNPSVGSIISADAFASADAFFASHISNWTPVTDQSSYATLKAQDLQVAKTSGSAGSYATATMTHKMGCAMIHLGGCTVPRTRYFVDANYYWDSKSGANADNVYLEASSTISSTAKPYKTGSSLYYVLPASGSVTLSASNTLTLGGYDPGQSGGGTNSSGNDWSYALTGGSNVARVQYPSVSADYNSWVKRTISIGQVLYSDGAISNLTVEDITESNFSGRTAIGVIFALNADMSTADRTEHPYWTHGVAHALRVLGPTENYIPGDGDHGDYKTGYYTYGPMDVDAPGVTAISGTGCWSTVVYHREGYSETKALVEASQATPENAFDDYPAALAAYNFQARSKDGSSEVPFSGPLSTEGCHWYLPACGQLVDIGVNYSIINRDPNEKGGATIKWSTQLNPPVRPAVLFYTTLNDKLQVLIDAGYSSGNTPENKAVTLHQAHLEDVNLVTSFIQTGTLWSSSEYDGIHAYDLQLWYSDKNIWYDNNNGTDDKKSCRANVLPVISF